MKNPTIYRRIILVAALALLILLACFQLIPLTLNEADWLSQTALQTARSQRIAKNALILAYRPDSEHAQAINELQTMLPVWEAQQARLRTIRNPEMSTLIAQAQPDYIALDTAATKVLAHPKDTPDITQLEIVLEHERNYVLVMSQVSAQLQERVETFNLDLALTQNGVVILLVAATILLFVLPRQASAEKERNAHD